MVSYLFMVTFAAASFPGKGNLFYCLSLFYR